MTFAMMDRVLAWEIPKSSGQHNFHETPFLKTWSIAYPAHSPPTREWQYWTIE